MLQSAKNLVKFVQKFNPSGDATITLGINRYDEIEALFYLNQGGGEQLFAKIMPLSTIEMEITGAGDSDRYIRLAGELDGYKVRLTFVKDRALVKPEPAEQDNSEFLTIVSLKPYFKRLTREEWLKFEMEYNNGNKPIDNIVEWFKNNKESDFPTIIASAFTWSKTIDGSLYWMDIHDRKEDIA
jgi:hypothetical protein